MNGDYTKHQRGNPPSKQTFLDAIGGIDKPIIKDGLKSYPWVLNLFSIRAKAKGIVCQLFF